MNTTQIYDWNVLSKSNLYKEIFNDWETLLKDKSKIEKDYHKFIQDNPYFFFSSPEEGGYLVISKLDLGDYITDFVVVKEGYSDGTIYELIEIQSPHTNLFTQKGFPTEGLNEALQQIRDWKRFLKSDKDFFRKNFPTTSTKMISESKIKFSIIIGNETSNKEDLEKRRQISEEEGVKIYSYDRMTFFLKNRGHFSDVADIYSSQFEDLEYSIKNQLANPFATCISHSDWRRICKRGDSHIYYKLAQEIIDIRENNGYFEKFKLLHSSL
jgi:hypothetical protein